MQSSCVVTLKSNLPNTKQMKKKHEIEPKKVWPKKEKKKKNDIKKDSNSNQIYKMFWKKNMKKEDNIWLHKKDSIYSCFHEKILWKWNWKILIKNGATRAKIFKMCFHTKWRRRDDRDEMTKFIYIYYYYTIKQKQDRRRKKNEKKSRKEQAN